MKRFIWIIFIASVVILATDWAAGPRACKAAGRTYIFSTNPWADAAKMKRMYRPLLDYLEEQTGAHFEMIVFPTYDDFIKEVESGYVDFAASSGAAFLRLRAENAPIRYLVTSLRQQGATQGDFYTGYIVVRKDSGITDFSQLRDKKFAFTEPDSSSGYKMPVAYMARQGLDPKTYFKKYFLVGDHNEVMKAIKNRAVDGGAT